MSKDFANRQRWSIDQKKRAAGVVVDYDAEREERLRGLKGLANHLADKPRMAPTLKAVHDEIRRLEG